MDQELKQIGKLALQLKLTPGLLLNLELLQLPILKLEEVVLNELEENPLLEMEEETKEKDEKNEDIFSDFIIEDGNIYLYEPKEEMTLTIPTSPSLRDILLEQARLELNPQEFEIALYIVDNLDQKGYLTVSEEEIARKLSVSAEKVKKVREQVKRFSPVGCASYTLSEIFAVQMEELQISKKFIKAVEKLELLKKGKQRFMKATGLTEDEYQKFIECLKRLDPEPGNLGELNTIITPDLRVYLKNEQLVVKVLFFRQFNLRINNSYLRFATTGEIKKYISEKYQRALALKKAIEQRNETLKKIGEVVFKVQREFLNDGKTLKPLSYQEVSEKLSIHESTVSRAVKDKFVETPFGIFPFRFFFPKSVSRESIDKIKSRIREIIESENKKKPLSDSKIAEILKKEGIKIARRTVAKYREEMGIPGAFHRREKE
ncbi:RNA polymerase, sigma 54 subunit, RpoN [Desulfurobacterium thermolithotrophum DSM 11699]|uniref:RNA polymerase, sigma 54 subunit, RpoN n=1 Tax=Desulfurobacterium thermolithotrophum (strain DSM 11699 / BSA) TaxID=868864 RepID=F0S343_DESTD|nr:RNA polymerase factor sigma-54 [Desulfurobacterium thermolithotrophum]ADY73265.1 RNA polymerase, sigma 54 subunit, RpoN [Desulfurobacterium thermolithotrophum DSM 11699]